MRLENILSSDIEFGLEVPSNEQLALDLGHNEERALDLGQYWLHLGECMQADPQVVHDVPHNRMLDDHLRKNRDDHRNPHNRRRDALNHIRGVRSRVHTVGRLFWRKSWKSGNEV